MNQETRFAAKVDKRIKNLPNSFWFNIQQAALRGHPDRIGIINGTFVALELKASAKAARAELQKWHLNKVSACGGYARFVYPENFEEIFLDLKRMAGV